MLPLLLIATVSAMTKQQADITIAAMERYNAPSSSVIIGGIQRGTFAFTEPSNLKVYINYAKFIYAPTSLINTLHHEIAHLNGGVHNTGPINDIMRYKLTTDSDGNIINDELVWA